jgi:hypothetical protein
MSLTRTAVFLALSTCIGYAQNLSPAAETSVSIAGKNIDIKYSAPSVRGRQIFGDNGILKNDATYPVWRAGANEATRLHTDATLTMGGVTLVPGDYSLYVQLNGPSGWVLIVNKQVGQSGTEYDKAQDVGRVPMKMLKSAKMTETFKITLASAGGNSGKLTLEWDHVGAQVDFTVK